MLIKVLPNKEILILKNLKKRVLLVRRKAILIKNIIHGFVLLRKLGRTPEKAYHSMRELFVLTSGESNDFISVFLRKKKYQGLDFKRGVLNIKNNGAFEIALKSLSSNGYYVFDSKLDSKTVDAINAYVQNIIAKPRIIYSKANTNNISTPNIGDLISGKKPHLSPVYDFTFESIINCKEIQSLIFDESILAFAQEYLKTKPILDLIAMWYSFPFMGKGKSESAQLYHFDLDRIKFIKIFFYLTDVEANTGPHCYVKGSHRKLHPSLKRDGRFSDDEVESAFGSSSMVELGGLKGTIMAVDTRGLHKGKELIQGNRLIFQLEFANSMFGQNYTSVPKIDFNPDNEIFYNRFKFTYGQMIK